MNKKIDEFFENNKHILSMPEKPFESVVIPFDDLKAVLQFIEKARKVIESGDYNYYELFSEINPKTVIKYIQTLGDWKVSFTSNQNLYEAVLDYGGASHITELFPANSSYEMYPEFMFNFVKTLSMIYKKSINQIVFELLEMQQK